MLRSTARTRMLLLAVLPLVGAIAAIGALLSLQMKQLELDQQRLQQEVFLTARREELKNYVALALTSIEHVYGGASGGPGGRSGDDPGAQTRAQAEALAILRAMNFGDDGYFFVYDTGGRNLMHPRQPQLQGQLLIDLRDQEGVYVIRELIARAREGGGFQRYHWPKPSSGQVAPKLGYAVLLERWGWMLGTGLYVDDIESALLRARQLSYDSTRRTLLGLAAVAVVATLGVFAGGLWLNISEQRQADRRIRELADRVVRSQEEERGRVSRELHDHICQLLVAILYRFEYATHRVADPAGDGPALLREATRALSQAIGEVRQLSHALRPALLDDLGLAAGLRLLGNELAQRSGMQVRVAVDDGAVLPIGPEQEVDVFRIAQQALLNVERHAGATQVEVELACRGGGLQLRIADDGCGFDVERAERRRGAGIGLSNMRHRADALGARLSLRSSPGGGGTELTLRLTGRNPTA